MLNLLLMAGVLVGACIIAVMLMNRLTHSAKRLSVLHDEMARNEEQLNEQLQKLAALQEAPALEKNSENPREN